MTRYTSSIVLSLVFCAACTHSRSAVITRPFIGLNDSLRSSSTRSLHVLVVHGINCHSPGYSDQLQQGITTHLGLREQGADRLMLELHAEEQRLLTWRRGPHVFSPADVTNKSSCRSDDRPPALLRRTYEGTGGEKVTFVEVTWSPLSEALKRRELGNEYLAQERERRALVNNLGKNLIVNQRLSDAVVYLGPTGEDIRWVVQQGICLMSHDVAWNPERHTPLCGEGDDLRTKDRFVIISESLGSRIVYDTLWSPEANLLELELFPQIDAMYMLANQLPLIELASDGNSAARLLTLERDQSDDRLRAWLEHPAFAGSSADPCDALRTALEGDRVEWRSRVDQELDPRKAAAKVERSQARVSGASKRVERISEAIEALEASLASTAERIAAVDLEIRQEAGRLEILGTLVDEQDQRTAWAARESDMASREVGRLVSDRDALVRRLEEHRELTAKDLAAAEGIALAARQLAERLHAASSALRSFRSFRLPRKRSDTAAQIERRVRASLDRVRRIRGNVLGLTRPKSPALLASLAEIDRLLPLANTALVEAPSPAKDCGRACRDLETTIQEQMTELEARFAELMEKNNDLVRSRPHFRKAEAEAKKAGEELRLVTRQLQEAQAQQGRADSSADQATFDHRSRITETGHVRAELGAKRAELAELKKREQRLSIERTAVEDQLLAAQRELSQEERALAAARAEASTEALRGQYAVDLRIYRSEPARISAERRMLEALLESANPDAPVRECLTRIKTDLEQEKASGLPTFVAMSDPNDLLSYSVGDALAQRRGTPFANVTLNLANEYLWLFANPVGAHTRHAVNTRAIELIACGAAPTFADGKGPIVARGCAATKR